MSHYQQRQDVNQSVNTSWTQTLTARRQRAVAVSDMWELLDAFDWGFHSGAKRHGYGLCTPEQQRAWSAIVSQLKQVGLLSPTTAAVDVDVPRILREAHQIKPFNKVERLARRVDDNIRRLDAEIMAMPREAFAQHPRLVEILEEMESLYKTVDEADELPGHVTQRCKQTINGWLERLKG